MSIQSDALQCPACGTTLARNGHIWKCLNCEPVRTGSMRTLEDIEAGAAAATDGPWCWTHVGEKVNGYVIGQASDGERDLSGFVDLDQMWEEFLSKSVVGEHEGATVNYKDAAFIANARQDVPDLCARIRELEAEATLLVGGVCDLDTERTILKADLLEFAKLAVEYYDDVDNTGKEWPEVVKARRIIAEAGE